MKKILTTKEYTHENYHITVVPEHREITVQEKDGTIIFDGTLEQLETLTEINEELK